MNKELWSQKIKRVLDQIGLGYLWTKAHENDIGILNIIKQRLKDIELQRWLSDVSNEVRKYANQKKKLRTFRKFKTIENYKCEEYLNKEYRISVDRMAPDDVFLLLINPSSKNKPVKKLIAKYVFDCFEKRRSFVV